MSQHTKKELGLPSHGSADFSLAQTILNSLSAHVAILDDKGAILETNRAWQAFARRNSVQMRPDTWNVNYLEICDRAHDGTNGEASVVAQGIRDVIAGRQEEFVMDYPCHSADKERWFYMRVTRATGPGPLRIVVSHENITDLKRAEARLKQGEQDLRIEKERLEEANTVLKVLLRQRVADQQEMEATVLDNMRRLVNPTLQQLANHRLPDRSRKLVARLEVRLAEITQPLLGRLAAIQSVLTPQEVQVAALIREGLSTKEIADQLALSSTTINFHRRNLRRKLNLRNTGTNLRTFLMGLRK